MTVYLNQVGIVCSLGATRESVLEHFIAPRERAHYLTLDQSLGQEQRSFYVGKVNQLLPSLADYPQHHHSRNNQLALLAYEQIRADVEAYCAAKPDARIGVVVGTSTSGISDGEAALAVHRDTGYWPQDYQYRQQEMGDVSEFVALLSQAQGPCYSLSTACSSSGKALLSARYLLDADMVDAVICGGVDSLARLPVNGFAALEATATEYSHPFRQGRDGINLGEAAALFLMSKEKSDVALLGGGESTDAHHISAPHPDGYGASQAMNAALADAKLDATQLDYVNAHGTGTPLNDAMESEAIYRLVGDKVPVSSSKELTGHTLGAAGALEAGLCWLLLSAYNRDNALPMSVSTLPQDPTLKPIRLSDGNTPQLRACLSNSFAFGGNNVSLILGRASQADVIVKNTEGL